MNDLNQITDQLKETIFELRQENLRLRGQITYLQEALSSEEDDRAKDVARLSAKVDELETQLGNG